MATLSLLFIFCGPNNNNINNNNDEINNTMYGINIIMFICKIVCDAGKAKGSLDGNWAV